MFWGICSPMYSTRPAGLTRHGDGSGPATGHQKSSAAARNSTCSSRCAHSFSSATSNSGEKWLPHMTPANSEPRHDRERQEAATGREWSTGRIRAAAHGGRRAPQQQHDRPRVQQQQRRDQDQQQVLDHVHREQRRVVGRDPRVERDQQHDDPRDPRPGPPRRNRVRGVGPVHPPDAEPPHEQRRRSPAARPAGSNVHPNSSVASVGGSVGTVPPWASTAPGAASRAPCHTGERDEHAGERPATVGGVGSRDRTADAARIAPGASHRARDSRPRPPSRAGPSGMIGHRHPRSGARVSGRHLTASSRARCGAWQPPSRNRCRCPPGRGRRLAPSSPAPSSSPSSRSRSSCCSSRGDHAAAAVGQLLPDRRRGPGHGPRARDAPAVRHRVLHRRRDLRGRRGRDRLHGLPLPPQAGRRHAAAPDPRQQPRRGHLDRDPARDRAVPVPDLVADPQHRRRQGGQRATCTCGPSPPASSGSSTTSTAPTPRAPRSSTASCCRSARTAAWCCRSASRSASACPARTSSTPSTSRSSCSSGTSCRASSTSSTSRSTRPAPTTGQCAELCGTVPRLDAVRGPRPAQGGLRRLARGRDREGPADARAAAVGRSGQGEVVQLGAKDTSFSTNALSARRTPRSRSTSRTRTRSRTTSRSRTGRGRPSSRASC